MIRSDGSVQRQFGVLFDAGSLGAWGDGALLDRFLAGRDDAAEAAFAALVERHGPMVLRACRATLGDEHAAHDAFQATFLILARKARTVRIRDTVGPWLYGVAWRVASRARAADQRRRRHERRAAEMAPRSFESAHRDDAEATLHDEVRRLPAGFREAVILCDLEGLTTDQAAERLGTPVGTVRSRLYRGRDRLRGRLLRRGIAPAAIGAAVAAGSVSAVSVPSALAEATVGLAIVTGWSGVVPIRLAWLVGGGRHVMGMKSVAAMSLSLGLVAGVGGIAAQQGVGTKPGAKPGDGPAVAVAAADDTKRTETDLDRLQGRWILVSQEIHGGSDPVPSATPPPEVITVRGDRIVLTRAGKDVDRGFTIDATGDPKTIMIAQREPSKPGILAYELDGRRLRLTSDAEDAHRKPRGLRSPGPSRPLRRWDLVRDPASATAAQKAAATRAVASETLEFAPTFTTIPGAPPAPPAPPLVATDLDRFQGRWIVVSGPERGALFPGFPAPNGAVAITFERDRATIGVAGSEAVAPVVDVVKFAVDAAGDPKTIQITRPGGGQPTAWAYQFDRGRLRLIGDADDPSRLPPSPGSNQPRRPVHCYELLPDPLSTPPPVAGSATKTNAPETREYAPTFTMKPGAPPAPPAAVAQPGDIERLEGNWTVVKVTSRGEEAIGDEMALATVRIGNSDLTIQYAEGAIQGGKYRLLAGTSPPALRVAMQGKSDHWLYAFEGDRLKLACTIGDKAPRAESFDQSGNNDFPVMVYELEREPQPPGPHPIAGTDPPSPGFMPPLDADAPTPAVPPSLQGRWEVMEVIKGGYKQPNDELVFATFDIHDGVIERHQPPNVGPVEVAKFRVDPDPSRQALVVARKGKSEHWLYERKGDRLRLAFTVGDGSPRPKSFDDPGPDAAHPNYVLELAREGSRSPRFLGPPVADQKSDRDRLQGRWSVTKMHDVKDGVVNVSAGIPLTVQFRGDEIDIRVPGEGDDRAERGKFRVEPGASPPAFRMEGMGKTAWMLYELKDGGLKLAFSQGENPPRPKSFDIPGPDPKHPVTVWELVKETTAPAPPAEKAEKPAGARPPAPPADARADLARILGSWTVVGVKSRGEDVIGDNLELGTIRFRDDMVEIERSGAPVDRARFRVIPGSSPPALRVVTARGLSDHWLYAIDGTRLKLALTFGDHSPRVKSFDDPGSDNYPVRVYELERADEPDPPAEAPTPTAPAVEPKPIEGPKPAGEPKPIDERKPAPPAEAALPPAHSKPGPPAAPPMLQGRWTVTKVIEGGEEFVNDDLVLATFDIRDQVIEIRRAGEEPVEVLKYRIDPDPKRAALLVASKGKSDYWLREQSGDRLRLAFTIGDDPPRVTSFDDLGPDPKHPVEVLELVREGSTPPPRAASPPAEAKADRERLQGRWAVMKMHEANRVINAGVPLATVQFRGDEIDIRSKDEGDDQAERGTFSIEPGASPPAFRVQNKDKTAWMLYELKDGGLKLAFAQGDDPPRPRSFDIPGPDPKHPVAVWEMVRITDPPAPRTDPSAPKAEKPPLPAVGRPPAPPVDAKADRERLQGRWVVISATAAGKEVEGSESMLLSTYTFEGNEIQMAQRNGQKVQRSSFVIVPDDEPRAMLIAPIGSADPPLWVLYAFERNRLRIAMSASTQVGGRRPKGFDSTAEEPVVVLELIRDVSPAKTSKRELPPPEAVDNPARPELKVPSAVELPPPSVNVVEPTAAKAPLPRVELPASIEPVAEEAPPTAEPHRSKPSEPVESPGLELPPPRAEEQPQPSAPVASPEPAILRTDAPQPQLPPATTVGGPASVPPSGATPQPAPSASQRLQGTWSILAVEEDGREINVDPDSTALVTGNALVLVWGPKDQGQGPMSIEAGTFNINERQQPKWIDLNPPGDHVLGSTPLGIVRLDGPTLLLCLAREGRSRPTEFDTQPESGCRLFVLRRKKAPRSSGEAMGMPGMPNVGAAQGDMMRMMRMYQPGSSGRMQDQPGMMPGGAGSPQPNGPGMMPGGPGNPPGPRLNRPGSQPDGSQPNRPGEPTPLSATPGTSAS